MGYRSIIKKPRLLDAEDSAIKISPFYFLTKGLLKFNWKSIGLVFKLVDNSALTKLTSHFNVNSYWQ